MSIKIYAALKAADIDGSGSIGVGELYAVIGNLVSAKRTARNLTKLVAALMVALVLALASIFIVSMLAGEAIKESKVNGGAMTTPDGKTAVAVDTVESTTKLWDLPAVDTVTLAKMKVRARSTDSKSQQVNCVRPQVSSSTLLPPCAKRCTHLCVPHH